MHFYWVSEGRLELDYEVQELATSKYLPSVLNPVCGHRLAGVLPLPIEPPKAVLEANLLRYAGDKLDISTEDWIQLRQFLIEAFMTAGHAVPVIFPGVRIGPLELSLTYRDATPDLLPFGPDLLLSGRLVDAFIEQGISGFDAFPAKVFLRKVGGEFGIARYYEVLTTSSVPFSHSAGLEVTKCESCGLVETIRYKSLTIAEAQWDGSDFVRVGETWASIVSERVKHVAESINATGIQFLPADRISVGPDAPDTQELLAELEFERQMKERR